MRSITLLIFMLFSAICAQAQSEAAIKKAAEQACLCLGDKELSEENLQQCIISSLLPIKENLSTVEGIQGAFEDVVGYMQANCPALQDPETTNEASYDFTENEKAADYFRKGNQLTAEANYKKAAKYYLKAVKADPAFVMAMDNLAVAYRKAENLEEAAQWYEKSLELKPDGHLALMNLGVVYRLLGRLDDAQLLYEKFVGLFPENPEGYFGLAQLHTIKENYSTGLKYIFKAHKLYVAQDNPYQSDSQKVIQELYEKMMAIGEEESFMRIAEQAGVEIYDSSGN